MVWDKSQPQDTSKIRLTPALIRANWDALEEGGVPFDLLQLAEQALDPAAIASSGQLYSKQSGSRTEAFYEKDNGDIAQLTGLVITSSAINGGTAWGVTTPWGLKLNWAKGVMPGATTYAFNWPVPFTTIHTAVVGKIGTTTATNPMSANPTNANITLYSNVTASGFSVFAIGV